MVLGWALIQGHRAERVRALTLRWSGLLSVAIIGQPVGQSRILRELCRYPELMRETGGMSKPLVTDDLWMVIEPLLPPEPKGGGPRINNRAVLTGIVFVLKSGIPWEMLPQELGCGRGMTCWRWLCDWQHTGVWERLDWSRASRWW
jgi:transposase